MLGITIPNMHEPQQLRTQKKQEYEESLTAEERRASCPKKNKNEKDKKSIGYPFN